MFPGGWEFIIQKIPLFWFGQLDSIFVAWQELRHELHKSSEVLTWGVNKRIWESFSGRNRLDLLGWEPSILSHLATSMFWVHRNWQNSTGILTFCMDWNPGFTETGGGNYLGNGKSTIGRYWYRTYWKGRTSWNFPLLLVCQRVQGQNMFANYQVAPVPPAENENEDKENSLWRRCLLTRHSR